MAAGTSLPETSRRPSDSDGFHAQVIKYDRYIESQLHRTRRQVKGVDIASSLMLLAVASLAYLMLVALADHWLVTGGLGFASRVAAFGLLAAGMLAFLALRLGPLLLRRVNPVYAAYTIERNRPGIKNSLINFLLLRSGSERLSERIYEAMESQAVNALTATHAEVAVDRTPVIRLLLAMVAILMCVAFYAIFSPKNPFTSFRRVISPWSDVAPPTRVSIAEIEPGNGQGFHDQHVVVSALVGGLRLGEDVTLRYSTRDGQVVAKSVRMALAENGYRHTAELPPDNLGLQQDLEYWIEAGDAISPHYQIKVDTAPTMVLEEIEYQYPKYSELPPRKVARHGDIQALEGTRVTLRAKANQPIAKANLDFECDGRNDLEMRVEGTRAEVTFPLVWNEKTRRPEHESYQLRFRNADGHENPKPIRYSIEVVPDLPPEVELVEPELDPTKELVVPADRPVRFAVEAADPDFKLAAVKFHARRRGTPVVDEPLLAAPRGGEFRRDYVLDVKRLALKPGEPVEFWAAADDNRQPDANHRETPHYQLRIATPDDKQQPRDDQNAENSEKNGGGEGGNSGKKQPRSERNENEQQGDQGDAGEQPSKQKQGGDSGKGDKQDEHKQESGDNEGDEKSSSGGKSEQGKSGKNSSSKNSSGSETGDGDADSGKGGQGQKKAAGQKGDGDKSDESKRIDPERDPGKAIEEINKYFNQKQKQREKEQDESKGDDQKQEGEQPGEKSGSKSEKEHAGSKGSESDDSQESESGDQAQPDQKGGKSSKKSSSPEGGASGGRDDGGQKMDGSKDQRPDKRPAGKEASGQPQEGEQEGEGDAKSQQGGKKQTGAKKPAEEGPLANKKKEEQSPSEGERSAKADGADDSQGDTPKGEKQAGKSGKQPSAGEKGAEGSEQGTPNEGGDKTMKDETGGSKEGDAKVGDEGAKSADQETRPRDGQGGQAKGAGEADDKMKKHEGESPDQKGGDQNSRDKGEGGAGNSEGGNKHGAPETHGGNQGRKKEQLSPDNKKGTTEDEPESSSESKRQSDSQGGQQGDQDGGGKSGGGQRANNEGTGTAGQNSEADSGGQQGQTKGKGPTGEKGGDQQKGDKPSGGKSSGEKGPGTNQGQGAESDRGIKADSPETADPRGHTNESQQPTQPQNGEKRPSDKQPAGQKNKQKKPNEGAPQSNTPNEAAGGEPTPSDRGGNDLRGGKQRTNPTQGGQPGPDDETTTPPPPADDSEPGGDDPNQEYARKATDLALERLRDQLAKDKPDPELLKKLEWSREDLERFYQQWERLKKSADEAGPKGDAARQELDDALRSLGLRPRGASLSGQKHDDRQRNLREDRRIAPPPEYLEQWREFNKATAKSPQQ
jgi:collagen type III alpha